QPYLLMLSSRKEKSDSVTALDAGADDFISKPFNIQETQARLRVAVRAIERQQALRRHIAELQEQIRVQRSLLRSGPSTVSSPHFAGAQDLRPIGLGELDFQQFDAAVAKAFERIEIADVPVRQPTAPRALEIVAWTSFLLHKEAQWVDMFLEIDEASLPMLMIAGSGETDGSPAAAA